MFIYILSYALSSDGDLQQIWKTFSIYVFPAVEYEYSKKKK